MKTLSKIVRDPSTQSNYDHFSTKYIRTDFAIDFAKKCLIGEVQLRFDVLKPSDEIVLDTSYLDLQSVTVDGSAAPWTLDARTEPVGSALRIKLERDVKTKEEIEVAIRLSTTEKSTALQWLEPKQTSNGKHPYIFSQCEAIHARSIFPCQDTPDVKSIFDYRIRSPLPVITSGNATGTEQYQPGSNGQRGTLLYTFLQEVPIPSYLYGIASGDIATAPIGPRSFVATGPEELVGAKWELEEDTEKFIEVAEGIIKKPYVWGTYNVLVLPPSFPYGGMENPVYTFATPSIISGDRQNVDVIAHELSHSWSGNLVSNASWEHFWLNEGWTTYLERRIIAAVHGEPYRSFSAIIGFKELEEAVEQFGAQHAFTKLVISLDGKSPDDAFSTVPYEKGFLFLYSIEKLVGQKTFDRFITEYFSTFAGGSLDSYEFKAFLIQFFDRNTDVGGKVRSIDFDTWFHGTGLPPRPNFDTTLVDQCYALADKWLQKPKSFEPSPSDIAGLQANQLLVFLAYLQDHSALLSAADVRCMEDTYGLGASRNLEVATAFLSLALQCGRPDKAVLDRTVEVLGLIGRMKFVRPLFKGLKKMDAKLAAETFERYREFYHPICRNMVTQLLAK